MFQQSSRPLRFLLRYYAMYPVEELVWCEVAKKRFFVLFGIVFLCHINNIKTVHYNLLPCLHESRDLA